jgi:hypothetical protein
MRYCIVFFLTTFREERWLVVVILVVARSVPRYSLQHLLSLVKRTPIHSIKANVSVFTLCIRAGMSTSIAGYQLQPDKTCVILYAFNKV